jgi:hypothetical protein
MTRRRTFGSNVFRIDTRRANRPQNPGVSVKFWAITFVVSKSRGECRSDLVTLRVDAPDYESGFDVAEQVAEMVYPDAACHVEALQTEELN